MKNTGRNANDMTPSLPKPVLDRIRRYAKEGREPRARYGHDGCALLAFANGQLPVVILRSSRKDFTETRSAALVEWTRAARSKAAWRGRVN
jgi:RNA:NAD 2'-phosphotransferase (TPT1/KptA family)